MRKVQFLQDYFFQFTVCESTSGISLVVLYNIHPRAIGDPHYYGLFFQLVTGLYPGRSNCYICFKINSPVFSLPWGGETTQAHAKYTTLPIPDPGTEVKRKLYVEPFQIAFKIGEPVFSFFVGQGNPKKSLSGASKIILSKTGN
jgi:hypothetical protein